MRSDVLMRGTEQSERVMKERKARPREEEGKGEDSRNSRDAALAVCQRKKKFTAP